MRLGQLARKISIRQSDMVDFLVKSGVSIVNDSNARLEDEHVQSIIRHFAPSFLETATAVQEPVSSAATIEQSATPPIVEEEIIEEQIEISDLQKETPEPQPQIEEIKEVIKAPKVDLPGLKVLGKIELPEPKKKEVPVEATESVEILVPSTDTNAKSIPAQRPRGRDNSLDKKRERPNRSSVNPIALQREREARAAEEKRRADAIKEKEKRTEYYLNRVKTNGPTKAARIYSEQVEEFTITPEKEPPKTWLGKFFRWLTTA